MDIPQGSVIQAVSTVDPGLNQTVSVYQWTLDGTVLPVPVDSANITIDTLNLSLGAHTLLLSAQNSCGNWGSYSQSFNIIVLSYEAWIASMGGISAIKGNLTAVGNIIDGYLGMVYLGFTVTLANVGTTIDYYLGLL